MKVKDGDVDSEEIVSRTLTNQADLHDQFKTKQTSFSIKK